MADGSVVVSGAGRCQFFFFFFFFLVGELKLLVWINALRDGVGGERGGAGGRMVNAR